MGPRSSPCAQFPVSRRLRYTAGSSLLLLLIFASGCGGGGGNSTTTGGDGGGTTNPPPTSGFSVLLAFNAFNGSRPTGSLTFDSLGNLYGTTESGGTAYCPVYGYTGCGSVDKLTPSGNGTWTQTILYNFTGGSDGSTPDGGVTFDSHGNLYGVANEGGGSSNCASGGCATVFELSPSSGGQWTETTLFAFSAISTGIAPLGGVTLDSQGNLYGTTYFGGDPNCQCGLVFELTPTSSGPWKETVLHSFTGGTFSTPPDGGSPQGRLVFDSQGNLYGTSSGAVEYQDDAQGPATAFELTPASAGGWTYATIHQFSKSEGSFIFAGLILNSQGNLYGTAQAGGAYDEGTVFELTPGAGSSWTENTLYSFQGNATGHADGALPSAPVLFDSAGNLYGATSDGGGYAACPGNNGVGCGTIFKLTPGAAGSWSETVLYQFMGPNDGIGPWGLVLDSNNHLYGVATLGAASNDGAVFRFGLP